MSGADHVLDLLDFDARAAASTAVVVGEGRLDSQTGQGRIIAPILARSGTTPVFAVVGSVHEDLGAYAENFAGVMVASDAAALEAAGSRVALAALRTNSDPADGSPKEPTTGSNNGYR